MLAFLAGSFWDMPSLLLNARVTDVHALLGFYKDAGI